MTAYLLNLADLVLTLHALSHGGAELNPLLQNPAVMVAWKVCGVGVLCWWLSTRKEPIAQKGLKLLIAVYSAVCIYHFYFIFGGAFYV
jgi:hypothetical protein